MKKRFYGILSILLILLPFAARGEDRIDYERALEKYKNNENDQALALFEKFVSEHDDSIKTDDAIWYMGRIYKRLDDDINAALYFKKVLTYEDSNRMEEAAYDLGRILYSDKYYRDVIELLEFIDGKEELNSYHVKGLELRSRAWYRLAFKEKTEYNREKSLEYFHLSLSGYNRLESLITDEKELSQIRFSMARIYSHLSDLTYDPGGYEAYIDKTYKYAQSALPSIEENDIDDAQRLIGNIEKSRSVGFTGRVTALGGADILSTDKIGADVYATGSLIIPTGGRSSLEFDLSFKHDNFNLVTFDFDPAKTGDERLVQRTETFGFDINWRSGDRRYVYNKLQLSTELELAEDIDDNYFSAGVSDLGSIRFNKNWRFMWDSDFLWTIYPNYLSSGRKLDSVKVSLDPSIRFYALDWLTISLIYGFDLKQYLDSKYDTIDLLVPSTEDKLYMTNSGEIVFDIEIGNVYNPELSYKFNYLKTFHYDYWVTESSGPDFIEDYYDYISHTFSFDNRFNFGDRFGITLDSSVSLTNFLNYKARDATDTYIGNEDLRKDITVHLDLGVSYLLWTSPGGTEFEALLEGWLDYKTSNMTFNTSFDTNYLFTGAMIGVSVNMP